MDLERVYDSNTILKDVSKMSETVIYGVKLNGEVEFVGETRNAWKGAMHVWTNLAKAYAVEEGLELERFRNLWRMTDKGILTDFENIVMKSTFDNVIVKKEDIPKLVDAFRQYDKKYPNSSLLEQANIIEGDILNDQEMMGVCWNQTSINRNPWVDGYDEENEEYIPYNVQCGNRHWYL
ncbi:hypothetical protein [Bacillus sp. NPDC094106]|uniref:hypothetical protein n=1 Tax=Bacillus sp. NPDC094106 TaxID=3363949 RepID=UPI0037FE36EE